MNEGRQSLNPIALRKAKIVYNFGLSECSMVIEYLLEGLQILLRRDAEKIVKLLPLKVYLFINI